MPVLWPLRKRNGKSFTAPCVITRNTIASVAERSGTLRHMSFTTRIFLAIVASFIPAQTLAQQQSEFEKRFHAIMNRQEYKHARFGVEFYSLDEGKVIYSWNPNELFVPGSTTKILTVGTALEL